MPHDIFISYRRNGGEYTAKILRDRLSEAGYRVFFDVESLRSGDFNTKLYSVIDECTDFLLVLSPSALDRCVNEDDWVRREIEYALEKGKNIVPVMLRGFSFPVELPPSIEPLRFRNGLEANSQFFEAFLQQLQEKFLLTRPTLRRRLSQNSLLRRTLPVLLAMLIIMGAGAGIRAVTSDLNDSYPRSAVEKSLVDEVLLYVESNLTATDLIAKRVYSFIDAGQRYLSTSSGSFERLRAEYDICYAAIEAVDLSSCAADQGFLTRLADSPLDFADLKYIAQDTETTKTNWLDNLDYLLALLDPGYPLYAEDKMEILDCYRQLLSSDLEGMACNCNLALLPVTNEDALDEFFHAYLPILQVIPLSASGWERDAAALESRSQQCLNRMDSIIDDINLRIGDKNRENAQLAKENEEAYEALIRSYMDAGYSREEATAMVDKALAEDEILREVHLAYLMSLGLDSMGALERYSDSDDASFALMEALVQSWMNQGHSREEAIALIGGHKEDSVDMLGKLAALRDSLLPTETDSPERIWSSMAYLLSFALFDDARACVDAYGKRVEGSEAVTAALHNFINMVDQNALLYGVMVTGYYEPDGINEVLRPGDIIFRINGTPCGSYTTFTALKSQCEGEYTVTVLRHYADGSSEVLELTLTTDMPRLYLSTVVDDGTDS